MARLRPPPAPRCSRCDFPLGTGRTPSHDCLACQEWPEVLSGVRTAVLLEPPADALVHALKYEGWRRLAEPLAARMARLAPPSSRGEPLVVVPVPTTAPRLRRRGYNQARLLARAYARRRGLPLADALERRTGGSTQVALHPAERRANVARVFHVPGAEAEVEVRGRRVLLVDDVLTTGATVVAAALALERAGAIGVSVIAFARAVPRRS